MNGHRERQLDFLADCCQQQTDTQSKDLRTHGACMRQKVLYNTDWRQQLQSGQLGALCFQLRSVLRPAATVPATCQRGQQVCQMRPPWPVHHAAIHYCLFTTSSCPSMHLGIMLQSLIQKAAFYGENIFTCDTPPDPASPNPPWPRALNPPSAIPAPYHCCLTRRRAV
jgi:hypothetical protein